MSNHQSNLEVPCELDKEDELARVADTVLAMAKALKAREFVHKRQQEGRQTANRSTTVSIAASRKANQVRSAG